MERAGCRRKEQLCPELCRVLPPASAPPPPAQDSPAQAPVAGALPPAPPQALSSGPAMVLVSRRAGVDLCLKCQGSVARVSLGTGAAPIVRTQPHHLPAQPAGRGRDSAVRPRGLWSVLGCLEGQSLLMSMRNSAQVCPLPSSPRKRRPTEEPTAGWARAVRRRLWSG